MYVYLHIYIFTYVYLYIYIDICTERHPTTYEVAKTYSLNGSVSFRKGALVLLGSFAKET